eukprot:TRINITY_DN6025_c0_g1_i4.p1 TRINITY_DN6025_c0_g1~~TRINITY_DN6025_c0_g1_i4.p1  ORF type:complete len:416 (-),score=87.88 TRINITY_DN6025_c0_g1_i4:519-1766(-)
MGALWTWPAAAQPSQFSEVAPDSQALPLLTPSRQKQKVLKIKLTNGIAVQIVSDPDLAQSAAAVCVEAGSWQDPPSALGLAHFVEHMLFMGTGPHPIPGAFDQYLASIGAPMSNAQTGAQKTTYAFAAPHLKFLQALSLFAEFFVEPLFASGGADKERHAVNQEFEMHKDDDSYRLYFVQKMLANKAHPFHRFSIGSLRTLAAVDHTTLQSWFNRTYSANLMHISIYTALPCEQARDQVVASFSSVINRELSRPWETQPMLSPRTEGSIVHLHTLRDLRRLTLAWELPAMFAHARRLRPDRLVASMLGDEGPGSLLALLIAKQYATELSVGLGGEGRDNPTFQMGLQLTNQGVSHWREVLKLVFAEIARLQTSGVPQHVFRELQQQDQNQYQFAWRTTSVFDTAMVCSRRSLEGV